jgi:hypothetical protein
MELPKKALANLVTRQWSCHGKGYLVGKITCTIGQAGGEIETAMCGKGISFYAGGALSLRQIRTVHVS